MRFKITSLSAGPYDLERVFKRGTLIAALDAETDTLAEQALDAFISSALPPTAFDHGPGILSPFWLNLATYNGHAVSRGWTDFLGQRKQHVLAAVELAERDGWLFRLPFWPLPDHLDREPLIFFSDTGLHQRLMALPDSLLRRALAQSVQEAALGDGMVRDAVSGEPVSEHIFPASGEIVRISRFVTICLASNPFTRPP